MLCVYGFCQDIFLTWNSALGGISGRTIMKTSCTVILTKPVPNLFALLFKSHLNYCSIYQRKKNHLGYTIRQAYVNSTGQVSKIYLPHSSHNEASNRTEVKHTRGISRDLPRVLMCLLPVPPLNNYHQ